MLSLESSQYLLVMFAAGYFRNMSNIDLNSVRLCFQVFLPDTNKKFTHIVQPVVSQPIIDKSGFLCFHFFSSISVSTQRNFL